MEHFVSVPVTFEEALAALLEYAETMKADVQSYPPESHTPKTVLEGWCKVARDLRLAKIAFDNIEG